MNRIFILGSLVSILLSFSLVACGKRGDPHRPSDILAKSHTQTPAS